MKRLITLTICTFIGMTAYCATVQRTILSHKGTITQYDANHWQDAISDAVAGDTVYFTPGLFSIPSAGSPCGDLIIDKPITLIGAGVSQTDCFYSDVYKDYCTSGTSTTLKANVIISIPGALILKSTLLEGFYIPDGGSIGVTMPVTNLAIKRCQFAGGYGGGFFSASAAVTNLSMEQCCIGCLSGENLVNPDIHNCYIGNTTDLPEGFELTNCIINNFSYAHNCTLINCGYREAYTSSHNTFVNCMYADWGEANSTYTNCWRDEDLTALSETQIKDLGYIGTDGTAVGTFGGPAPFTLVPSQPYVSSSSVTYNKSTKKLNVNVTVKKGQ